MSLKSAAAMATILGAMFPPESEYPHRQGRGSTVSQNVFPGKSTSAKPGRKHKKPKTHRKQKPGKATNYPYSKK